LAPEVVRYRAAGGVDGGVVGVPGVVVEALSVVMRVLSVALPPIVRELLSEAAAPASCVSELWVLAQAAVITSVEATARP
jgi:hypothetical protein